MKNALLEKLGLNLKQIKIYRALLEMGSASVTSLAQKTHLYRHEIYKHIGELISLGIVTQSPFGKRTLYVAESPKQLGRILENMQRELDEEMPYMLESFSGSHHRPLIRYLEGEDGIRAVYHDLLATLKKGDEYYRYESPSEADKGRKYVPKEYFYRFRDKIEVERYSITNERKQKLKTKRLGRYIKAVPASYDLFAYDVSQFIYKNKVAYIDFRAKVATIIENEKIAEFQKKIFKLLFDKL